MKKISIPSVDAKFDVYEYRHALAILKHDFPAEFAEVEATLSRFILLRSQIEEKGGRKSNIADYFDKSLAANGWIEKQFVTLQIVDGVENEVPTHKIDRVKGRVALEIEWNNKDPFYDRDLSNFRILFDRDAISLGIIVTRSTNLQAIFNDLGKGASYGASTTHFNKLEGRIRAGNSGGCPILVFVITERAYQDDI